MENDSLAKYEEANNKRKININSNSSTYCKINLFMSTCM